MKENREYNRVDEQRLNLIIWRIRIRISPWKSDQRIRERVLITNIQCQ